MPTKWQHAYRKTKVKCKNGNYRNRNLPVLVRKNKGKEEIQIPSKEYVKKHHPRGAWDS